MGHIVRFDRFALDLTSGELRKDGLRIHLRGQSFQVLAMLLEEPGRLVTREDLRRRLWPDDVFVDFDNSVSHAVACLREALGDSAERPRFVETLPKRGYRFIAPVSAPAPAADANRAAVRILVLPFANLGEGQGQEHLGDAITEELITSLATIAPDRIAVIARTTAMRYRDTRKDVDQIGRELRVDYVVEGGVRRDGNRVTTTMQLVSASDQAHRLARRYETDLDEVYDLRTIAAGDIARAIGVAVATPASGPGTRKPTGDAEAYLLYLRGRSHMLCQTPEGFATAKESLERAVQRDPLFALAYDALAELHWYLAFTGLAPAKDVTAIGTFYAIQALGIDDRLAEAHALLGLYRKELDFNWPEVKREMDRARDLDAASPLVRLRYAIGWLLPTGQLGAAADEIGLALESDPQSTLMRTWLACMLWLNRDYERAAAHARLVIEFDPAAFGGYFLLGLVLREQGRFEPAIAAHRTAVELSAGSPFMLGWLALALGRAGRLDETRAVLGRLEAASQVMYVQPTSLAWTHYALGDLDRAFMWMDRAIDDRDHLIVPIRSYPFLDPIRQDRRYAALLDKLRFVPATAAAGITSA